MPARARAAVEEPRSRQHLEQDHAERPDIGALVDVLAEHPAQGPVAGQELVLQGIGQLGHAGEGSQVESDVGTADHVAIGQRGAHAGQQDGIHPGDGREGLRGGDDGQGHVLVLVEQAGPDLQQTSGPVADDGAAVRPVGRRRMQWQHHGGEQRGGGGVLRRADEKGQHRGTGRAVGVGHGQGQRVDAGVGHGQAGVRAVRGQAEAERAITPAGDQGGGHRQRVADVA